MWRYCKAINIWERGGGEEGRGRGEGRERREREGREEGERKGRAEGEGRGEEGRHVNQGYVVDMQEVQHCKCSANHMDQSVCSH